MKQKKPKQIDPLESDGGAIPRHEFVYRLLRADIIDGTLLPGQVLRQEELARRCNTSRVPVREAMSRLEADGLIVLRPNCGYTVTSLDRSDIVEIFELRMVIESHALVIAALARTESDIEQASDLIHAMENLDKNDPNYLTNWLSLNHSFHGVLIAATRRKRLIKIAETLRETVDPYIRVETLFTGHVGEADQEHREIFEGFRAGDARGLVELSRAHTEHTMRRLLDGLRSDPRSAPLAETYGRAAPSPNREQQPRGQRKVSSILA